MLPGTEEWDAAAPQRTVVVAVDAKDDSLAARVIVAPQWPDLVFAADVPTDQVAEGGFYLLHVEAATSKPRVVAARRRQQQQQEQQEQQEQQA